MPSPAPASATLPIAGIGFRGRQRSGGCIGTRPIRHTSPRPGCRRNPRISRRPLSRSGRFGADDSLADASIAPGRRFCASATPRMRSRRPGRRDDRIRVQSRKRRAIARRRSARPRSWRDPAARVVLATRSDRAPRVLDWRGHAASRARRDSHSCSRWPGRRVLGSGSRLRARRGIERRRRTIRLLIAALKA